MKRLHPHEKYALGILLVTLAWLSLRLPFKAALAPLWFGHLALLLAYAGLLFFLSRLTQNRLTSALRGLLAVIGVIGVLFISLGRVGFACMDWNADAWLEAVDKILGGGHSPSLWLERWAVYGWIEFLSFIYSIFIPYMYLSVFLSLFGRPLSESRSFQNGFVLLYALGYLGYLFMPATGPVDFLASQFQHALPGGPQYQRMMDGVRLTGVDHGAFPSLHVGASVYLCLFEWRHNRLRGIAYLPLAGLIVISTLFLRWHYLIDVLVGAGLAVAVCPRGPRLAWPPKATAADPVLNFLRGGGHEPTPLDWPADLSSRPAKLEARVQRWRRSRVAADKKVWTALQDFLAQMQKAGIAPGDLYLPIRPGKAAFFALRELEILVVGLPLALLGCLGLGLRPFSSAYRARVLAMLSRGRSFVVLGLNPALRRRLQSEGRGWIRTFAHLTRPRRRDASATLS